MNYYQLYRLLKEYKEAVYTSLEFDYKKALEIESVVVVMNSISDKLSLEELKELIKEINR